MQISGVELEDLEFDSIGSWPKGLRVALIIAAGLLTVALGYFFDLSEAYDAYNAVKIQRDQLEESFEKAYDQASNLEEYKKQVVSVEKSLESLTRQLPKSPEEAGLLDDISRQAISSGLSFQSFKPLPEVQEGFYVEHPIELLLQGGFHSFGEFASNISSMPRIVTIHDFAIKSTPNNPKRLDITVTVQTYWTTNKINNPTDQTNPATKAPQKQEKPL